MADTLKKIKGKCVDLSFEGKGVIKIPGNAVFVDALLPNEEADIEIIYKRNGVYFGKVKRLYNLSPNRIKPLCGVSTSCGGCVFQNYAYKSQLEFKKELVKKSFFHEFKEELIVDDVIGMDDPYYYRNKIIKPLGLDHHGRIISGFYRAKTHEIIASKECVIEDKITAKVIDFVILTMNKYHIRPYDEKTKTGEIRNVFIRVGKRTKEIMLVIITFKKNFTNKDKFFVDLKNSSFHFTSLMQNVNDVDTNVVLGEKEYLISGRNFIIDEILNLKFKINSKSFFQVNPLQTEVLYQRAIEYAMLNQDDVVLDAYSGIGTISLLASKFAKKVYGVEIIKEAYQNAIENAKLNEINNVEFINIDATEYLNNINDQKSHIDVLIMDPPRKGSTIAFLNAIKSLKIPRVVYISCNPITLARDIKILSDMYLVEKISPVDMFPFTYHVETVVSLINRRYSE